jgi:hypothetical protein
MRHHALHMSCQLSTTQVQDKIIRANNECHRPASRAQDAGGIQSNEPRESVSSLRLEEDLTLTARGARQGSFSPIRNLGEIEILILDANLSRPRASPGKAQLH